MSEEHSSEPRNSDAGSPQRHTSDVQPEKEQEIPAKNTGAASGGEAANVKTFLRNFKLTDWINSIATCVIACATIWSAIYIRGQLSIMAKQLDEAREEQRPWLQVIPKLRGPLANDGGLLKVSTRVEIRNIGHRPAVEVRSTVEMTEREIFKVVDSTSDRLRNFCTKEVGGFWKFLGLEGGTDIVFPEETEVVDAEAWTSEPPTKYGEETPLKKIIAKSSNVGVINIKGEIDLIYCVSYKTLGDTIRHHTGGIVTIAVPEGVNFSETAKVFRWPI